MKFNTSSLKLLAIITLLSLSLISLTNTKRSKHNSYRYKNTKHRDISLNNDKSVQNHLKYISFHSNSIIAKLFQKQTMPSNTLDNKAKSDTVKKCLDFLLNIQADTSSNQGNPTIVHFWNTISNPELAKTKNINRETFIDFVNKVKGNKSFNLPDNNIDCDKEISTNLKKQNTTFWNATDINKFVKEEYAKATDKNSNFITSGISTYRHDRNIGVSKSVYNQLNKGSGLRRRRMNRVEERMSNMNSNSNSNTGVKKKKNKKRKGKKKRKNSKKNKKKAY